MAGLKHNSTQYSEQDTGQPVEIDLHTYTEALIYGLQSDQHRLLHSSLLAGGNEDTYEVIGCVLYTQYTRRRCQSLPPRLGRSGSNVRSALGRMALWVIRWWSSLRRKPQCLGTSPMCLRHGLYNWRRRSLVLVGS